MKKTALQIADKVSIQSESPGVLQTAAPWLTAAGTGALGYGLLRRRSLAPIGTQLRALQEAAKDKSFSIATSGGTPWAQRIRSAIMGAPVHTTGEKVKGTILHHTPSPKGGGDVNINAGNIVDALQDKAIFDRVMREGVGTGSGMASSLPNTMRLDEALKRVGGDPKRLKEIYPDFMLKARSESMGRGIFKSLDDPGVNEAIQNPSQFIFQEKMPIKREFRVHTIDNEPFTATHRFMPNKTLRGLWNRVAGGGGGAFVPLMGKRRKDLHDFIRQSTAHLKPSDGKSLSDVGESMHVAWDVAELPDGTFKLIEANPVPGTMMNPGIAQKLQRQITGRWSRPVATLGGTALAGTSGIAANKILGSPLNNVTETSPMKKTAKQISDSVLLKTADREGNYELWRKQVDRIAQTQKMPKPTEAEFKEMFPEDFASSGKNLDEAIRDSKWFRSHSIAGSKSGFGVKRTTMKEELSPEEYAQWLEDYGIPMSQPALFNLYGQGLVEAGAGIGDTASGAMTAHRSIRGAQKSGTPAERYAALGLGGGLAGMAGGAAYLNFKNLHELSKVIPYFRRGELYAGLDALKDLVKPAPKIAPKYVGGLAGLGLGLGSAALWNHLAKKQGVSKTAAITPEEIAAGLAGEIGRADISAQEISDLSRKFQEEAKEKAKYKPLKQGLVGGLLGAGTLGSLAYLGSSLAPTLKAQRIPLTLASAGIGLGTGAGLGAISGKFDQYLEGLQGKRLGETLGNISQTGQLPEDEDRDFFISDIVPYATGTRPNATPIKPEEVTEYRNKNLAHGMGRGAIGGALWGIPLSILMHQSKTPKTQIAQAIATTIAGGILKGTLGSIDASNTLLDLHNRGYSQLAKGLRQETFGIED